MQEIVSGVCDEAKNAAGLEVGRAGAAAILAARENDGVDRTVAYIPGTKPGEYCPTPPDFTPAVLVQWGTITPFVLASCAQFRPVPPPELNSAQALAEIEEVKAIGSVKNTARTAEQSEIARFWYENSPQGWNRIAGSLPGFTSRRRSRPATPSENAWGVVFERALRPVKPRPEIVASSKSE